MTAEKPALRRSPRPRRLRGAQAPWLLLALAAVCAAAESADREPAAVAQTVLSELSGALQTQLAAGGPVEAVNVCTDIAPALVGRLSRETGWRVSRVGTRVRNPLLGLPDPWEAEVLSEFAARAAAGESLAGMSLEEVVEEPSGSYRRYMRAIPVQAACLACHGPAEAIPEGVRAALAERYPHDRATGYAEGELRGAISIKAPLAAE